MGAPTQDYQSGLVGADVVALDDIVAGIADPDIFVCGADHDITVCRSGATNDVIVGAGRKMDVVVGIGYHYRPGAVEAEPVSDNFVIGRIDFDGIFTLEPVEDETANGAATGA